MVASNDQSLSIVGDDGVLSVADTGFFDSPVMLADRQDHERRIVPAVADGRHAGFDEYHRIDFARGVADLAGAIRARRAPYLPVDHALHVLELTLALARASGGLVMRPETTFAPVAVALAASS